MCGCHPGSRMSAQVVHYPPRFAFVVLLALRMRVAPATGQESHPGVCSGGASCRVSAACVVSCSALVSRSLRTVPKTREVPPGLPPHVAVDPPAARQPPLSTYPDSANADALPSVSASNPTFDRHVAANHFALCRAVPSFLSSCYPLLCPPFCDHGCAERPSLRADFTPYAPRSHSPPPRTPFDLCPRQKRRSPPPARLYVRSRAGNTVLKYASTR